MSFENHPSASAEFTVIGPSRTPVYAADFNNATATIAVDGWAAQFGGSTSKAYNEGRDGSGALALVATNSGTSPQWAESARRLVSGLQVGQTYLFTAWGKRGGSLGTGLGMRIGIVGLAQSDWQTSGNGIWQSFSLVFTATATSHRLSLETSTDGSNYSYWDDVALSVGVDPLAVSEGDVTLDKGVAPYGTASVTVPLMDEELLERLDPYENQRVKITAAADGHWESTEPPTWTEDNPRTFDLVMRNRRVNHAEKTVELDLATDEALLMAHAPLVDDTGAIAFQSSLRGICNYVLGKAIPGAALQLGGAADVPFYVYADATNVIPNPRITGLADYAATRVSAILDTSWPGSQSGVGHNGVHLHTPTNNDSFVSIGGDNGAMRLGMAAGRTYTVSATGSVRSAIGGAAAAENDANGGTRQRSRSIVVHAASPSAPGGYLIWHSDQLPNTTSGNNAARVSVTFTLPADTTAAFIRAYHGGTSGTVTWSMFRLTETDTRPGVDNSDYFQGFGPNTAIYAYTWTGTPDASASRRIALIDRAPELLRWNAGDDAWSFLEPLMTSSKLKLWCDEQRRWWLTDPAEYSVPGRIVAQVSNTTEGTDTIDADDGPQLTGAIARFRWRDYQGEQQQRDDVAGVPGQVRVFEFDRPYPGPGTAAAILRRYTGQKRTQEVTVPSDYRVTPGQEISISLPGTADQLGRLQSVRWQLADGVMDLGASGITEVTPGSWLGRDPEQEWAEVPETETWATS